MNQRAILPCRTNVSDFAKIWTLLRKANPSAHSYKKFSGKSQYVLDSWGSSVTQRNSEVVRTFTKV
jgi:hypothetical protein